MISKPEAVKGTGDFKESESSYGETKDSNVKLASGV